MLELVSRMALMLPGRVRLPPCMFVKEQSPSKVVSARGWMSVESPLKGTASL